MADEAVVQEAQAKYEQQMAELRQRAEAAERAAQEAKSQGQEWEQRYQNDMAQVRDWAQRVSAEYNRAVQGTQQQTPAQPQEDEDSIATNKSVSERIKAMQQETVQQVAQAMGQQQLQAWKSQREANRRFAMTDPEMPEIQKYIGEIDQLLDSVHPQNAATNGAYREAYGIVWARHEMAERKRREEEARKAAEAPQDDDEDLDEGGEREAQPAATESQPSTPPAPPPGHFGAPMPSPQARTGGTTTRRAPAREPEDEFEPWVIQNHYGGDRKAYLKDLRTTKNRQFGDDPYDVLGSNGRTKF